MSPELKEAARRGKAIFTQEMQDKLLEALAGITKTKVFRKCSVTGELAVVGEDGLTDPERENHEQIKEQWTSQAGK